MKSLDCKGLFCPMPIVEVAKYFKNIPVGEVVDVQADDPAFEPDIKAWVECMGYKLIEISVLDNNVIKAKIEKTK